MESPLNVDKTGLRNRLHQSKDDKENHSENEYEFDPPTLLSNHSDDESDNVSDQSVNLIDLKTDLTANKDESKQRSTNERRKLNSSNATKFGTDNNFRFNFQMPKLIKTPDKVDEAKENFLDTVCTPSKRLQAQPENTEHKKVRLEENNDQPNWTIIRATFFITLVIALIKILLILYRDGFQWF